VIAEGANAVILGVALSERNEETGKLPLPYNPDTLTFSNVLAMS